MAGYPAPGTVILGRFRIESLIGEGGMGAVFRAIDISKNQWRALKFINPELGEHPEILERFAREVRATTRVKCENVVEIYGLERSENGVPFMVMELLSGRSLYDLLQTELALDIPRAVHFALQILHALQVAHENKVIHRDIKPPNCFVLTESHVFYEHLKLLDFGITKLTSNNERALTRTKMTLGTPAYMAPEQVRGAKNVEARTDLYSVGIVLYEMLTGKRPFEGENENDQMIRICTEPPIPLRHLRRDIPADLAGVVEKSVVKAIEARHANAMDFARALAPFTDARSQSVLAAMAQYHASPTPPPPEIAVGSNPTPPPATPLDAPFGATIVQLPNPSPRLFSPTPAPLAQEILAGMAPSPAHDPAPIGPTGTILGDPLPMPTTNQNQPPAGPTGTIMGDVSPMAAMPAQVPGNPVVAQSLGAAPPSPMIPSLDRDSDFDDPQSAGPSKLLIGILAVAAIAMIIGGIAYAGGVFSTSNHSTITTNARPTPDDSATAPRHVTASESDQPVSASTASIDSGSQNTAIAVGNTNAVGVLPAHMTLPSASHSTTSVLSTTVPSTIVLPPSTSIPSGLSSSIRTRLHPPPPHRPVGP